jgi:hypothetical protein
MPRLRSLRLSALLLVAFVLALMPGPAQAVEVLLIPESTNRSVQKFDPATGAHLGVFINPDDTNLSTPIDCAQNATGILVSDQIDDAVRQYDLNGGFIGTFASGIDNTRGMASHNGKLYCTAGQVDAIPHYDLDTGAPLGNFIGPGIGGLNSPFDILFRANDVLVASIDSDNILRYDLTGAPLGVFATNIPFGEQMCIAQNGNILVAEFTRNAIIELTPAGAEVAALAVSGPRGCYELANGNILTTNSTGVHEVDRVSGGIVNTKLAGVGARFIEKVDLAGVTSVEPSTWGQIKSHFQR